MYYQKKSHFKNVKQGKNDSKFEAGKALELEMMKKAGEIKDFEEQKVLELVVNGYIVCTYKIDFVVYHHDGTVEYIETKGWVTPEWKLKWKLFEALYDVPGNRLTLEFQGKSWRPQRRRVK